MVRSTQTLFIADFSNNRIRKIGSDGMVSTYAGSGIQGFADGAGDSAQFNNPRAVVVDSSGVAYISDTNNHCIRRIAIDRTVSTFAGLCQTSGSTNGVGTAARFSEPAGLTFDQSGSNLFIAGHADAKIRKIVISSATVSTFAGGASMGSADGQGTSASFNYPFDVAFNKSGYLFVADKDNHRIRIISPSGYVTTFAGSSQGLADGQGTSAKFSTPAGLAIDDNGFIYVADYDNQAIRKISPSGYVTTIVNSKNMMGDQRGPAMKASFMNPIGIDIDANGTIYVADDNSHKLEIICNSTCVNGIMNCFSKTCICDKGWSGATCGTPIPRITTTTTSKF